MKKHRFAIGVLGAEAMWDFAMVHEMNIHSLPPEVPNISDPGEKHRKTLYVYEAIATDETFLVFKLTVDGVIAR